jgi:hypothetical protein
MKSANRHHYIPIFLQKGFLCDGKNVRVFDKLNRSIFIASPVDVFVEKGFNTVGISDSEKKSLEPAFTIVDNMTANIINTIRKNDNVFNLSWEDHCTICSFVALMMNRPASMRNKINDLYNWISHVYGLYTKSKIDIPDETIKKNHLKITWNAIDEIGEEIFKKQMYLIKSVKLPFVLGDSVISLYNDRYHSNGILKMGLKDEGIRIHFPISNTRCLGFCDPNVDPFTEGGFQDYIVNKQQYYYASKYLLVQECYEL